MKKTNKRKLDGTVIKNKMDKTVVVEIIQMKKHNKYNKLLRRHKHVNAHSNDKIEIGTKVVIE